MNAKRPPKTIKEKKFVKEYIKTGNATESASRVYDVSNRESAGSIGTENLQKLAITEVMEKAGLTDDKLVDKLNDGLDAVKPINTGTIEDYQTRHRYLETAFRLKGYNTGENINVNIQNNVVNLPTKIPLESPPQTT